MVLVFAGELEHRIVERVEAGEGDELELVAHGAELTLELGDRLVVELLLPVEGRRTIVGEQLARMDRVNAFREAARFLEVRLRSFAPNQVGIRRVCDSTSD